MTKQAVVLEGFHVCKHAVRFGADIVELVTPSREQLVSMLDQYASDVRGPLLKITREISRDEFQKYSDVQIRTPLAGKAIIGLSDDPIIDSGSVVLLDNPRDLENIGAVVRLCAGMGIAAVVTTGNVDPWHKNCLRGSQGLHFALPVLHTQNVGLRSLRNRQVIVFDESGGDLVKTDIPDNALLVFGSERQGVSEEWLNRADIVVRIPQRNGVSSYNLASSVAIGVYHAKYKGYNTHI